MAHDFLHDHPEFENLIRIVSENENIAPYLVEKDYWIMHCIYSLKSQGFEFQLKGGTSLSKGFGLIHRFSEDIDIHIDPPVNMKIPVGKNHESENHIKARGNYYDWLARNINITGITGIERDHLFDNKKMWSGGIRLNYNTQTADLEGVKQGILLEAGFDKVTPNEPRLISSWVYDYGAEKVEVKDNRAKEIRCYIPSYTFVEKLQTISTKYRNYIKDGNLPINFMRHYYDVYCLLKDERVLQFIGSEEYSSYKKARFPREDELVLEKNEAFKLNDTNIRKNFEDSYQKTTSLYYKGQIDFNLVVSKIHEHLKDM